MDHFYTRNKFVRVALTLLAMFCFSWTFAEDITAEQAMQLARTFVSGQKSIPGQHNSTGMTPQLTQAKKVSGLYVFNVANNGGFIIVSNDDRTTPILGFSESGNLDPDNMPSNMRAWIQGYADEIAWMQKHDVKPNRLSKAPLSVGSHKTDDIAPMVKTTWDQGSPYNNLCPYYSGTSRSVTGCVATAMAQVMKYHEWPKDETKSIPGYTTESYGLTLSTLPAVTFDWANMLNSYQGSSTAVQKTAVATLMQYCGYSVKMNYGPSSGAYTDDVATALKAYFDYNNKTTQYVTRSHYTYADWTDLIYYELEHERPVVYGGQSSGGGHEFVCDGYKYESGTDFFHINWGWSGASDNYFVLSALDPDIQGIGGSSSTDGFHFGQDAVIGIQPSTGTGTIADITPNVIDLTLVDAYANPSTVLLGKSVDLVVKVTNNSKDPYDGDIMLYDDTETGIYNHDILSDVFYIEPGETKECVFTITPTKLGSYSFVPLRNDFYYFEVPPQQYVTFEVVEEIAEVPDGLTVYDGTVTNQKIPAYIYYFDDFTRSQFVIPAAELAEMKGGSINSISFYTNSGSSFTTASPVDVYMKEVDYTTINAFETKESATMVYQGKLRNVKLSSSGGLMTITLSTPYSYGGGNLLIGIENTTDAGFKSVSFYGTNVEGASISGRDGSSLDNVTPTQQNFLPKTTFTYEGGNTTCVKPASFEVSGITTDAATFNWEGDADNYTLEYRKAADKEYTVVTGINATTYTLENLTQNTTYSARVKTVCGVGDESGYRTLSFTTKYEPFSLPYAEGFEDGIGVWTLVNCTAGTGVGSISHEGSKGFTFCYNDNPPQYLISPEFEGASAPMEVSFWYRIYSEDYPETFQVGYSTTTNDVAAFEWEAEVTATNISEWLQYETTFPAGTKYVAIKYNSYDKYYLFLDDFNFTVSDGFVKPANLAASEIGSRSAVLSWTERGTATAWVVAYKADGAADFTEVNAIENPYTLTGLTPETTYTAKVRQAGETDKWSGEITFTTDIANPAPTAVAANNVMATTADIAWTGNDDATSYNLRYRTPRGFNYGFEQAEAWAVDDFAPCTTYDGDGTETYGFQNEDFPNESYTGACIAWQNGVIEDVTAHTGNACGMMVNAIKSQYPDGVTHTDDWFILPELTIQTGDIFSFWAREIYTNYGPEVINVGVYGTTDGTFEELLEGGSEINIASTTWTQYTFDLSAYVGQTIKLAINCVSDDIWAFMFDDIFVGNPTEGAWDYTYNGVTSPYEITGLEPETDYEVQVQAMYGDEESSWVGTSFTTLGLETTPFNLQTADVTATTATLNWDGVQDNYNVRYRTAEVTEEYYFNNFNGGYEAVHADGWNWDETTIIYGLEDPVYNIPSNENFFLPMGWKITDEATITSPELPEYESGAVVEFYHFYYSSPNTFQIGYSSTTNDLESFTWSDPIDAGEGFYTTKYREVLPDGVKYVAFKATASGQAECVFIDNFRIYKVLEETGEWISATSDEATLTLTGLTPGTEYEWQVQGNLTEGTTEWSEPATFTTNAFIELADYAKDNSDIIDANKGKVADVTLAGRTLYKDGKWNTICLPFDVTIEGSVLEGAIARELTDASISGSTLNLTFDETAVSTLVAGTPYIIRWATEGEDIENPVFEGVTIDATDNSFDSGSGETRVRFLGTYDAMSFSDDDNESVLLMGGNNELRYANAKAGLGACRAYFKIGDDSHAARRLTAFHTNLDDETMGIRSIENGPLTKDNDDAWYSLDGRRLVGKPTMKGVYINKGNKITIK